MDKAQLKQAACAAIETHAAELIAFGEDVLRHPEAGFREMRTGGMMRKAFERLELSDVSRPARTGVKGWLRCGAGPCAAVIGELDAVLSPRHPFADPATGAAHACGHNAQLAALVGCAVGLAAVREQLGGDVCFLAAPAEEYMEIGWREGMRRAGELCYLGGKQQMIAEGVFDDIDLALMVHGETDTPYPRAVVDGTASGFIGKEICFLGREAHAGGAPWEGVNALNAAALAISAIHFQRETFRDEDRVRVHPILTKGGELVNTVPAEVRMESYVRAAGVQSMRDANDKVNRAIRGAAYAVGAGVEISDLPGYLPLEQNRELSGLFAANAAALLPEVRVERGLPFCGSTDMGDVSYLMPVIQPTLSGFTGAAHSRYFSVADPGLAYIAPARLLAATVIDLLAREGGAAGGIIATASRRTKEDYRRLWQSILENGGPPKNECCP